MIHEEIMNAVASTLTAELITNVEVDDPAKAGIVILGPLQGNPDPDEARISVTIHENDPDETDLFHMGDNWQDEVEEIECGGAITWRRRFSVYARCLLENTQESLSEARHIASIVRSRIEKALLQMPVSAIGDASEYVSRGVYSDNIFGEMVQAGGPDAYDFHIKVRFELLTTTLEE